MADIIEPQMVTPEGDDVLVLALAGGKSQTAAAELAGVCRDTVYRRMQDPAFNARIDAIRQGWLHRAAGHLADAAVDAVVKLRNIINSEGEEAVHVAAAKAILANLDKAGECPECKRRAQEAANPRPKTLEEELAYDAMIVKEYERIQAELAEADRRNKLEEEQNPMPEMEVLCYADERMNG